MRISDWSSDVCSSDLSLNPRLSPSSSKLEMSVASNSGRNSMRRVIAFMSCITLAACSGAPSENEIDMASGETEQVQIRSEEQKSALQSLMRIQYAVLYLKKKHIQTRTQFGSI